jgi:DNA-binding PadR family transcriptional regulator
MSPVFRHGRLRLYLLRLLDEEPRHGYEVIRLLRDRFMGVYAPSPGTIYPRLARLEEEGLVTHDEENGRKVYRITEAGREELRNRGDELDELEEELSASVSDIVREVREDVRETVRSLREELTWAAREMRRTEREAAEEARDAAQDQGREAREAALAQAREVREQAKQVRDQAREQARQAREQARQARDEALGHAQWLREGAAHLRDDARGRFRSVFEQATAEHEQGSRAGEPREGEPHDRSGRDWGSWLGGEWARWADWQGRKSWPGPRDMAAFHDLERLAKEFATDLRKVAWDSGTLHSDVVVSLRDILEDTLDRIRTEVFGVHEETAHTTAAAGATGTARDASPAGDTAPSGDTPPSGETAQAAATEANGADDAATDSPVTAGPADGAAAPGTGQESDSPGGA